MIGQLFSKSPTVNAVLVLVIAAIVVTATYLLARMNKEFSIGIGKEGAAILVKADDSFNSVLNKAIETDSGTVEAILGQKQYYKLTSVQLVDALRKLDASQPDNQRVSQGLRTLLWDLKGPFALPGTLRGADLRMMGAFDDLEEALKEAEEANHLFTELWRLSLERKGVFKPRLFHASIEIIDAPTDETAFACPGSMLVERLVFIHVVGFDGSLTREVTQNPLLFHCDPPALTARQMLAGGTVRLGLSERAFENLVGDDAGIGVSRTKARFEVYPRNLAAAAN